MRVAVIGHVEWVDFLRVRRLPTAGDIVRASSTWALPGGGGSVAAVQLAKLAGVCTFFTALGDDELGRRSALELERLGVRVEAALREEPTRRAITHVDGSGERTITVLGDRLAPLSTDALPWNELAGYDAVYVTACDPQALRTAREAKILVATSRIILPTLRDAGVRLDALVGSALDPSEAYEHGDLEPVPGLVVRTRGAEGGAFSISGAPFRHYEAASLPAPIADAYGCGDSFAAGLAFALGEGKAAEDAIAFAARCGAAVLTGNGPYEAQLRADGAEGG
jgi:ribokinase